METEDRNSKEPGTKNEPKGDQETKLASGIKSPAQAPSQKMDETAKIESPPLDKVKTEHWSADSKEKIIEVVREIHQTAKDSGGIDPKCFEDDNTRYEFKGTEEELCNLIKEVIFEDEDTKAYAEKTDRLLKEWEESLTREEGNST